MANFDINVDRRTDGKSDAYIAPCYKQVGQKKNELLGPRVLNNHIIVRPECSALTTASFHRTNQNHTYSYKSVYA